MSKNLNEKVIMVYFHKGQLVLRYALVRNLFFINCLLLLGIDPQTPTPARIRGATAPC